MTTLHFTNPFKPGAGHMPPYLAGRTDEMTQFNQLLQQTTILENLILTGLRGVGKTVLLNTFKPLAIQKDWLWVGTDLTESASVTESSIAIRLLADLALVTSSIALEREETTQAGFKDRTEVIKTYLNYDYLTTLYNQTPGLVSDKLKQVLEVVWHHTKGLDKRGIIFAYDEAQTLADHAPKEEYPLSVLLSVFQSLQSKNIPFMLVLTGLQTLFPKLVAARTFTERMFRVVELGKLSELESKDAIQKPIEDSNCPVTFTDSSIDNIFRESGGYPYFIQFICKEVYDIFIQRIGDGEEASVLIHDIIRKLDKDFFAARWSRVTDRQRDLLIAIASLEHGTTEFSVLEVVAKAKEILENPFSSSHVNQMLSSLINAGIIYRNRHGKYSFAVPLLDKFIIRQSEENYPI